MPVSIQIGSHQETGLDKVLKGVSIARDLFGIVDETNKLFKTDKKDQITPLTLHEKGLAATPIPEEDLKPTGGEAGERAIKSGLAAGPIAPEDVGPALSGPPKYLDMINGPPKPGTLGVMQVTFGDGVTRPAIISNEVKPRDIQAEERWAMEFALKQKESELKQQELALKRSERDQGRVDKKEEIKNKPQEALDTAYAKDYADRIAKGGYSNAEKGLAQIKGAIAELGNTDSATGPFVGSLPKAVRDIVTPSGASIQDVVEQVVQQNLRPVLGAQFTQNEGDRLIQRAYNPRQSEAENIKRLDRLQTQMAEALGLQKAADEYFAHNGTLKGFSGKLFTSADDFHLETDKKKTESPKTTAVGGFDARAAAAELERRRAKK
jgi:hypothetical protein